MSVFVSVIWKSFDEGGSDLVPSCCVVYWVCIHSAAGPRRSEENKAFFLNKYLALSAMSVGLDPSEKLILFSIVSRNDFASLSGSLPENLSRAKSGNDTLFSAIFSSVWSRGCLCLDGFPYQSKVKKEIKIFTHQLRFVLLQIFKSHQFVEYNRVSHKLIAVDSLTSSCVCFNVFLVTPVCVVDLPHCSFTGLWIVSLISLTVLSPVWRVVRLISLTGRTSLWSALVCIDGLMK